MEQEQERIWSLLARKLAGEATEKELQELDRLTRDKPEFGFYMQVLTRYWNSGQRQAGEGINETLRRIRTRIANASTDKTHMEKPAKQHAIPSGRGEVIAPFSKNMLWSYVKFTWRILFRNKAFSFINITGLSVGMASAVLMLLIIRGELSVDQFHSKKDRIYQLYNRDMVNGEIECWPATPMVMAPVIKMNYPEAEEVTRVNWVAAFILKNGDKQIQTSGYLTDPGFLTMFDFPLVKGDRATALGSARSIVITESLQKKLFGEEDAMGKTIKIDSNALFTVTGVVKNPPYNSRFSFEYLVPWSYMKEVHWENTSWKESSIVQTYVLLKPGITEQMANARFRDIIRSHAGDVSNEVFVHPMRKWYLWSRFENGVIAGGNIEDVRMFSIIAGLILLIACINYMNISTARSVKRAKEVGIRKVAGAGRRSLISQFLVESIMFSFLSGLIALLILTPGLTWFNNRFGTQLAVPFTEARFWLYAAAFVLFTGILAGSYPAFYLSAYKPIRVLKGFFKGANALVTPRKVLVVVQFSFAIALIICTVIIYRQISYGKDRNPGYNQDDLVVVYIKGNVREKYGPISRELMNSGAITGITQTNSPITEIWTWDNTYTWEGKKAGTQPDFIKFNTDRDFVNTIGLQLKAGRDIDIEKYPSDSTAVLINEAAARLLGFADPVGRQIQSSSGNWQIVGVINNFVSGWPYMPVQPAVVEGPSRPDWSGTITFRLNPNNGTEANLDKIAAVFKKFNPDYPFEYHFVDDMYASKFEGVKSLGTLASLFAALTILISCLGLFALATYMAENRIKEIGVRKVLGASAIRITTLLSKEFLKLVLISFVIASPVAWWAMNAWLSDYAYRVTISWWIFVFTGLLSLTIALLTVGYQAVSAARANPVKSLRTE